MLNNLLRTFFISTLLVIPSISAAETVTLDPAQSSIRWVGKKVTGSHNGSVALDSGEVELVEGALKSGKFKINIGKVVVEDLTDPEYNAKLTKHLKSEDFFAVEKFPLVDFNIKSTEKLETPGKQGENTLIHGELTIKGLTHAVDFPAVVKVAGDTAEAQGSVALDRTKWEIKYGSGKFFQGLGDKLIYDEFEVQFHVKGKVKA